MARWLPRCPTRAPRRCGPPSPGCGATSRPGRPSDRPAGANGSGACVTGCSTTTSGSPSCSSGRRESRGRRPPWRFPSAIDLLEYYRKRAEEFLADSHPRPHDLLTATKKLTIAYRPYPVVGVICPWNNPVLLALGDALPALLAGAAVAIKPSELTPLATREIVRGWREDLGAPEVIECLTGAGATGAALVDEADYIQFTGSTRTGRKIAQRAAERLIPYSLELGGKDAMIVLADADLERAANAAVVGRHVQQRPDMHLR